MSNYNKSTNFSVKDTLQSGDPDKIVSGAEIDNEFNAIAASSSTKIDKISNSVTGNLPRITSSGNLEDSGQNSNTIVPVATILMYASDTAPSGWLVCDGSEQLRSSFPNLFSTIGTFFGQGDGSTTFNLPDLRDRFPLGRGSMGGNNINRIEDYDTELGDTGGEAKHTLNVDEMPSHNHDIDVFFGGGGGINSAVQARDGGPIEQDTALGGAIATGGGQSHNNIPLFQALNFIIKT